MPHKRPLNINIGSILSFVGCVICFLGALTIMHDSFFNAPTKHFIKEVKYSNKIRYEAYVDFACGLTNNRCVDKKAEYKPFCLNLHNDHQLSQSESGNGTSSSSQVSKN